MEWNIIYKLASLISKSFKIFFHYYIGLCKKHESLWFPMFMAVQNLQIDQSITFIPKVIFHAFQNA